MASKQTVGVNLKFSADVSAARQAMQGLQTQLTQISNMQPGAHLGTQLSAQLGQAQHAATQLRISLQQAFNQDTGKLNLTKFNQQMKSSGMTLEKYKAQLTAIGPQGQQAFNKLAFSIATAETPILNLSNGIKRLGTTFMNTMRYQLSASVIMGFVQGVTEAVDHIKELNTSLNNIRIVTEYGAEEMDKFAAKANKAAKALSTTTTAMTNASLIYFQQGLNMEEAQKRAEITVKLANVTGEAVETVSDQLTAVWNNFYDGSQNLEYYADVLTALGAATASSSEEISEGLEKFAAVAGTVGLSYEYATAALATVTATTRQSADVVGTAFKTLFARMQDLELGKTLDDGVTLGKYAEGLAAIGVNILDSKGNLKDMNNILDEMGAKWNTLSKAQQVSLAQTVAGTRQYTQLIALMDDWSYFQENLSVAQGASGSLQKQQDIYAESWEAASQRVTAALETIYNKLLDDDFFIDMLNSFTEVLDVIDKMIDGLNGLPGILSLVATALLRAFNPQIAAGANNVATSIMSMTKIGKARLQKQRMGALEDLKAGGAQGGFEGMESESLARRASAAQTRIAAGKRISEDDRAILDTRLNEYNAKHDAYINSAAYQQDKKTVTDADILRSATARAAETSPSGLGKLSQPGRNISNTAQIDEIIKKYKDMGVTIDKVDAKIARQYDAKDIQAVQNYIKELETLKTTLNDVNSTDTGKRTAKSAVTRAQKGIPTVDNSAAIRQEGEHLRQAAVSSRVATSISTADETAFASIASGQVGDIVKQSAALEELQSRLRNHGVTATGVSDSFMADVGQAAVKNVDGKDINIYQQYAAAVDEARAAIEKLNQAQQSGVGDTETLSKEAEAAMGKVTSLSGEISKEADAHMKSAKAKLKSNGANESMIKSEIEAGNAIGNHKNKLMADNQQLEQYEQRVREASSVTMDFGKKLQLAANTMMTMSMIINTIFGLIETWQQTEEEASFGDKLLSTFTSLGMVLPMAIMLWNDQTKAFLLTAGGADKTAIGNYLAGKTAQEAGLKAKASTIMWKGLGKTLLKFAAVAAVVAVVVTLAKAANEARNATANFASTAAKGARDAAEAYNEATTAFNNLKNSISKYEDALTGLQKLTQGTNEYKEALFDANEQALELVQNHAGLKYYIDSNGLIVFENGELDRIQEEAQQKKVEAYGTKLAAERGSREAGIENRKVQLGRKLKGYDAEWNDEDDAAVKTGSAVGVVAGAGAVFAGAKIGALIGSGGGPIGAAIGAGVGVLAGLVTGLVLGAQNDATNQEKDAMDALYEAYKEQGDAALTPDGIKQALGKVGIDDQDLIDSLAANKDETRELMQAMQANTVAIEAETLAIAKQQAHAIDSTLQYRDSNAQNAVTQAMARARTNADKEISIDPNNYRSKELFGWWYNAKWQGEEAFKAYLREQGLSDQIDAIYQDSNFNDNEIKYSYVDKDGNRQEKELTYTQLAAWEKEQVLNQAGEKAYTAISQAVSRAQTLENSEGLLSVIGGQNLMSLSESEYESFKSSFKKGAYKEYIEKNWEALGYESADAFTKAIGEQIANYDPEEALSKFSKQMKAEIDGILQTGAQETEYTEGALKNYTEALAENNEALHDNADEWKNLEKKKIAAQSAVANAKFVKGVDKLTDVLADNIDALLEWNEASLDTWEAADKVQTALEDVFGVRVSADFVKNNLAEIQKLAQGSTENIEKLSRAAAEDFVLNLDTVSGDNRAWFANLLNDFAAMAANNTIEIGMNFENEDEMISRFNNMLDNGEITAEQLQQAFNAIGYAPDIKYRTDKQRTVTTHYIYDNGYTEDASLNNASRTITQVTETDVKVPYIAGKNTQTQATDIKGSQENGSGIRRNRDIGSIGASLGDTKKQLTNKIKGLERYKEINEQLSDIERHLDKISKAKDRAFGQSKLKLIDQEIEKQKELITAEKAYLAEIQKYYNQDAKDLDSRFKLDSDGRISNYTQVLRDLLSSGIDEDSETYKEIKASADQYIETLNLLESQQEKVNDQQNVLKDLSLEKIEYEVEFNVHINDRDIKHFEYLLENLDDPIFDAAKALEQLGNIAEANISKVDAYRKGIIDILGEEQGAAFTKLLENMPEKPEDLNSSLRDILGDKTFTANEISTLEGYIDSLYDASGAMDQFYSQTMEKVNGAFEEMNTNSEKTISRIKQLSSTLDTYKNVIDLVGKKSLGVTEEQIRELGRAQIAAAKQELQTKKEQLKLNESALSSAEEALQAAKDSGDEEGQKYWQKQVDTMKEKVWELQGDVESAWGDTLQAIADDFTAAVESATTAFEEAMTGIWGSYDRLQEAFDQRMEKNDRFVDDYKKIYELSKLNRDLNKSLDDTDSIKGKQALRDLQEEINRLQESDTEMSQYDLDYLRKKYDLRVAEIALEEAQNAKSQVRMRRDSEGNWGYVYTADQESIGSAQQNYEDKLYALQELSQNYIDETQSKIIQSEVDIFEAVRNISRKQFATEEEYQAEVTRITEYYTCMRNDYLDELNKALDNSKTIYDNDWNAYNEKTGYKISKEGEWRKEFGDTELALVTGYGSMDEARSKFESAISTMLPTLKNAFTTWESDVKKVFSLVEQDFDNFSGEGGTLDTAVTNVTNKLGEVGSAFGDWKSKAQSGFQGIIDVASEKQTAFYNKMGEYKTAIENVTKALTEMLKLAGMEIPETNLDVGTEGTKNGGQGGTGHAPPSSETPPTTSGSGILFSRTTLKGDNREYSGIHGKEFYSINGKYYAKEDVDALKPAVSATNNSFYEIGQSDLDKLESFDTRVFSNTRKTLADGTTATKIGNYWYSNEDIAGAKWNVMELSGGKSVKEFTGKIINYLGEKYSEAADGNFYKGSFNKGWHFIERLHTHVTPEEMVAKWTLEDGEKFKVINGNKNYMRYKKPDWKSHNDTLTPGIYEWDSTSNASYGYINYANGNHVQDMMWDGWSQKLFRTQFLKRELESAILNGDIIPLDTGGYTGSWDSSGRLAMLHQKEIVLNAHDTENFLAAVNIVRDIAKAIDLQALSYQHQLAQLSYMNASGGAPQTVQQEVTIRAEFPNATDRHEIEAAFASLVNDAAQFANRKK